MIDLWQGSIGRQDRPILVEWPSISTHVRSHSLSDIDLKTVQSFEFAAHFFLRSQSCHFRPNSGISALIELFWGRHHCLKFVKNQLMMNSIEEKLLIKWWNSLVFLDDLPLLTIAESNISFGTLALKCQKLNSWRRGWSNQKWCLLYYINDAQI